MAHQPLEIQSQTSIAGAFPVGAAHQSVRMAFHLMVLQHPLVETETARLAENVATMCLRSSF
jgi:hypothetical protein